MLRLQLSEIIKPNRDDKGICFTDYVDIYVYIYIYIYIYICVCVCVYVCVYMYTWPAWLLTGDWAPDIYKKHRNPDFTVRSIKIEVRTPQNLTTNATAKQTPKTLNNIPRPHP